MFRKDNSLKLNLILGKLSLIIGVVIIFLILNVFFKIIPFIRLGTLPLALPIYINSIGILLSIISLVKEKNIFAILGLILNLIPLIFQIVFIFIGSGFMH